MNVIEISSSYRNRNEFLLPSIFNVNISQSRRDNDSDPLSDEAHMARWQYGSFTSSATGSTITGTLDTFSATDMIAGSSDFKKFVWTTIIATNSMQQTKDYYIGAVIFNSTTSEYRRIVSFEYIGIDSLGTSDRSWITIDREWSNSTQAGDTLIIRDPSDLNDATLPQFFIPAGSKLDNSYKSYVLYNIDDSESRPILEYNSITHVVTLDTSGATTSTSGPITAWAVIDSEFLIVKIPPANAGVLTSATSSTIVVLDVNASAVDEIYTGKYLHTSNPTEGISIILSYVGATRTATLQTPLILSGTDSYDILTLNRDNENSFIYSGDRRSLGKYNIQLVSLIIPNLEMNVGGGGLPSKQPYMYVKFKNVSGSEGQAPFIINSNNPNSANKLFRVPIRNIPTTIQSSFLRLNGNGAKQTVTFDPNRAVEFGLYTSSGEPFSVEEEERLSPYIPNSNIQISACFAIKKIV